MNMFVLNTKEDILWETEQYFYFSPTVEVNGVPKQPDYKLSSEYLQNKHIHTGLEILEDRVSIFG